MKAPSLAPAYACFFPQLAEVARGLGYALAIHGTMARDLDLLACPWVDAPAPAKVLAVALWEEVRWLNCAPETVIRDPTAKPHGRLAWTIPLMSPAYLDLSVMPTLAAHLSSGQPFQRSHSMAQDPSLPAPRNTVADEILDLVASVSAHAALTRAGVCEKLDRVSFPSVLKDATKGEIKEDPTYPPYFDALRSHLRQIEMELGYIDGAITRAQV